MTFGGEASADVSDEDCWVLRENRKEEVGLSL